MIIVDWLVRCGAVAPVVVDLVAAITFKAEIKREMGDSPLAFSRA